MHDGELGQAMASRVTKADIERAENSGVFSKRPRGNNPAPLASPAHPDGHHWGLSLATQWLNIKEDDGCVGLHSIRSSPFFSKLIFKSDDRSYSSVLSKHTAMPQETFSKIGSAAQFYRFLGVLSSIDAAVACCLLTIEHPRFTSESLQNAKLLNSRGKAYLVMTDSKDSSLFTVDKPRAGSRKSAVLSPLAQKIVKDIINWTAPARKILREKGDKTWRFLFLGIHRDGRLGVLDASAKMLASKSTLSLTRLYPKLSESGLGVGAFDYRRIRTTMGVLRWFETGSIVEMSRVLGNTRRVVIEHYLPPALLHAWNTRIIRRFQNTLIVLAAQGEEYLLDVTDFTTVADLQHFIAQLIVEYPKNSSPLAVEVQTRLAIPADILPSSGTASNGLGVLNIKLSPLSLGYLYAFSEFASSTLSEADLCHVDPLSQLAPNQFVSLAKLIRHACEEKSISTVLRELLDLPRLQAMHAHAVLQQSIISAKISRLSLARHWG